MTAVVRVKLSEGVDLAVHDLGGMGPDLVLVHATGFCGLALAPMARSAPLVGRFHTWALDVRGHGLSGEAPDGDMSWSSLSADVHAVVGSLDLHRPLGFGHSMGAALLLDAEARWPGSFGGLWCFEPVVGPHPPPRAVGDVLIASALRRRRHFASMAEASNRLGSRPPLDQLAPEALQEYLLGGFSHSCDGTVELRCRPETEAATFAAGMAFDGFSRLGSVRTRVVVGRGGDSRSVNEKLSRLQAAALPLGRLQVLAGLGHLGPMQDPARVGEALAVAFPPAVGGRR